MTDRRKFLQLIASACAVAARPKILLSSGVTIEPASHVKLTMIGPTVVWVGPDGIYELTAGGLRCLTSDRRDRVPFRGEIFVA